MTFPRLAASLLAAGTASIALAGCTLVAPQATTFVYDASDGVSIQVGDVLVRNALVVTGAEARVLAVSIDNEGDEPVDLRMQYESASGERTTETLSLDAGEFVTLGSRDVPALELDEIDALPGELFPIYFQYGTEEGISEGVPVLDGTLPEYSTLVPTPIPTPAPVPTEVDTDVEAPGDDSDV